MRGDAAVGQRGNIGPSTENATDGGVAQGPVKKARPSKTLNRGTIGAMPSCGGQACSVAALHAVRSLLREVMGLGSAMRKTLHDRARIKAELEATLLAIWAELVALNRQLLRSDQPPTSAMAECRARETRELLFAMAEVAALIRVSQCRRRRTRKWIWSPRHRAQRGNRRGLFGIEQMAALGTNHHNRRAHRAEHIAQRSSY